MTEANLATAFNPTKRQGPLAPEDIVRDRNMSIEDKRARLASWASDARAVPNCPALRRLDDGNLVLIDEVLSALKVLDGQQVESARPSNEHTTRFSRGHWSRLARKWRRNRDDDDDDGPPTAPASMWPFAPVSGGDLAAAA